MITKNKNVFFNWKKVYVFKRDRCVITLSFHLFIYLEKMSSMHADVLVIWKLRKGN